MAELSSDSDSPPPKFSSLQIVQTPASGFELVTDMQSAPQQWINSLKAELEMPDDSLLRHLTISGAAFGPRWQNYNLRFVGVMVGQSEQTEYSCPFWRISDESGNHIESVQAWYRRVSCMSSPVYCDVRWRPDRGETISFPGAENAQRWRDVNFAWRGLMLLRKINPRGRPESSVSLTREQFFERAPHSPF